MSVRRVLLVPVILSLAIRTAGQSAHRPQEPVELIRDGSHVDVLVGGHPFTTYYFDPAVAKPYLSPLRSAHGTVVTRRFPMTSDFAGEDRDEPHQRAMYFAHGDINGFDFWGEAAFPRWSDHPASTFGRTVPMPVVFGPPSTSSRRRASLPRKLRHTTSAGTSNRG